MSRNVFLALASEPQEAIVRAALEAHGVAVDCLPLGAHLETAAQQAQREAALPLLVIDLAVLAQLNTSANAFCAWKRQHCAGADLILYCSSLHAIHPQARAWAQRLGARDLLPGCDLAHWRASLRPTLGTLLSALDAGAVDEAATARALQPLPALLDRTTQVAQAWRAWEVFDEFGTPPEAVLDTLGRQVAIATRRYRMQSYDACFTGTDAVACLAAMAQTAGTSAAREHAVALGQALVQLGYIDHVVREQPFRDGHFFYRLRAATPQLDALDLCEVVQRMRGGGVRIRDRKFHGVIYPRCFVGTEALAWMREGLALSENEAMTLGERLLELYVIHHVFDEHRFRNGKYFFRFYEDEP